MPYFLSVSTKYKIGLESKNKEYFACEHGKIARSLKLSRVRRKEVTREVLSQSEQEERKRGKFFN